MGTITKKDIEHLADLARLAVAPDEEDALIKDLSEILSYFDELKSVDTTDVEPMAGGTRLRNAFREDGDRESTNRGAGADRFPDTEAGFLKVPPVFE